MDTSPNAQNCAPQKKPRWVKAFLTALAETGVVGDAAKAAKIGRRTVYLLRTNDPEFALAWDIALEDAADLLERESVRRAREGLVRYKFKKNGDPLLDPRTGEPYYELEYSDTLLIFLLKGMRPNKYRENYRHEHTGDGGGAVKVDHWHRISLEEFRKLPTIEKMRLIHEMAAKREQGTS